MIGTYIVGGLELALIVAQVVGMWLTFEKAGEKGWKAIIPVYNNYITFKIAVKSAGMYFAWYLIAMVAGYLFYLPMAASLGVTQTTAFILVCALVSCALYIFALVIWVRVYIALARDFGKGVCFGWMLVLFPYISFLVLGLDKKITYTGVRELGDKSAKPVDEAPNKTFSYMGQSSRDAMGIDSFGTAESDEAAARCAKASSSCAGGHEQEFTYEDIPCDEDGVLLFDEPDRAFDEELADVAAEVADLGVRAYIQRQAIEVAEFNCNLSDEAEEPEF